MVRKERVSRGLGVQSYLYSLVPTTGKLVPNEERNLPETVCALKSLKPDAMRLTSDIHLDWAAWAQEKSYFSRPNSNSRCNVRTSFDHAWLPLFL
jgi:hypothetical protein